MASTMWASLYCTALQVIQTYARANKLPLDVMMFTTEVTNKTVEQVTEPAPLGCYIHGCVLEGARWVKTRHELHWLRGLCATDSPLVCACHHQLPSSQGSLSCTMACMLTPCSMPRAQIAPPLIASCHSKQW